MTDGQKPKRTYQCFICKGIFKSDLSDEEIKSEKDEYFANEDMQHCALVCDHCYPQVDPHTHPEKYRNYKAEQN